MKHFSLLGAKEKALLLYSPCILITVQRFMLAFRLFRLTDFGDLRYTSSSACVPSGRHHVQIHHVNTRWWFLLLPLWCGDTATLVDSLRSNKVYERKGKPRVSSRLHAQHWETGKTRGAGRLGIADEPSLVLQTMGKDGPGKIWCDVQIHHFYIDLWPK